LPLCNPGAANGNTTSIAAGATGQQNRGTDLFSQNNVKINLFPQAIQEKSDKHPSGINSNFDLSPG
jgi:hypothetical protein